MIFIKESAEFNAEPTKSTTSTVESVIALKDTTLSKELALNACLVRPIMPSLKLAMLFLA
jgi:hypothetical protein